MTHPFHIVDVFSEQRYSGNPLAVVVIDDAGEWSDERMRRVAAEINLSETTGNAAAFLGVHLLEHLHRDELSLRIEQGEELGRPSLVLLRARRAAGSVEVRVGGSVVPVVAGTLL